MLKFPFHPLLVHFPVAFYFLELLLLVLWRFRKDDGYLRFARFSFKLGYFFMLLAMIAGYRDAGWNIPSSIRNHFFAALGVFVIYTLRAFSWRYAAKAPSKSAFILILGSFLGYALVTLTGYFGGLLVYSE